MPDLPNPRLLREVRARLREDRTALADEYHIKNLFAALKDWKIYVHMLTTIGMFCAEHIFFSN
jgi:hypothetical protein